MLIAPTSIMLGASMVLPWPLPIAIAIAPHAAAAAAHVAAPRRLDASLIELGGTMRVHAC
jgi:hypothetical protein